MQLLLRRLWIQITSDRRRFGLLCAMLTMGMLLWARIIVTSNVPRTAVADPQRGAVLPVPGDGSNKRRGPPVPVRLARDTLRDPLAISDADFPRPTVVVHGEQENGKSGPKPVEDVEQALAAELWALANRFRLEGVMQGHPMAVINGRMYQLNDWVPAVDSTRHVFRLVEVGNRWVDLECEGHRFRVKMDEPGSEIR